MAAPPRRRCGVRGVYCRPFFGFGGSLLIGSALLCFQQPLCLEQGIGAIREAPEPKFKMTQQKTQAEMDDRAKFEEERRKLLQGGETQTGLTGDLPQIIVQFLLGDNFFLSIVEHLYLVAQVAVHVLTKRALRLLSDRKYERVVSKFFDAGEEAAELCASCRRRDFQ